MICRLFLFSLFSFCLPGAFAGLAQSAQPAQEEVVINIYNASFEDMPRESRPPRGWTNCGFQGESPPDTQPNPAFKVTKPAKEGNTYLGMVVRDNDTWEAVAQRLQRPLEAGKCYAFSIYLARSDMYVSLSKVTKDTVNYTTPSILRIWGGSGLCNKGELLAETSVITHGRWIEYNFKFEPKRSHTYLILEATYQMPVLFPYNGNILVDDASPIHLVPCHLDTPLASRELPPSTAEKPQEATSTAEVTPKPQPEKRREPPSVVSAPVNQPKPEAEPATPPKPKILADLDKAKIKQGQIIRIRNLYFEADTFALKSNSFPVLDEIYGFLEENPNVVVEIGGHTNGIPEPEFCDWLSTERAKAVASYLKDKGIPSNRLQYKGYGKRKPIASNRTSLGRKKNQRVEIKILSLEG